MNWRALDRGLAEHGLFLMGVGRDREDAIALIGAARNMWMIFSQSAEYLDGHPDPLDRWSKRIISGFASLHEVEAVFPSDGPPYPPFIAWAESSGRFWQSPTGMLVHDVAGLMISIRGALRFPEETQIESPLAVSPCVICQTQPCRNACPVDALDRARGYDVPACRGFLQTGPGQDCMLAGCKSRRACPISQTFERPEEQSAFHMKAFHPA